VSLALRALALVAAEGVDFHYTIAGGGPEIPSLKTLARDLGLEGKVEFHIGYSGDDYLRALHATDVYFLPSFRESTPVTLLEAYLAGCYPVVADTSAQGEIVRLAGGHAVPVEHMDSLIKGLADAILWCARHRAELPALAAASAARVAEHFSSERYDAVLDQAYAAAMSGQVGAAPPGQQVNVE
jgi:glycosyltransferase involved in cell wall biosynthesis